jgi:hypothetical protein
MPSHRSARALGEGSLGEGALGEGTILDTLCIFIFYRRYLIFMWLSTITMFELLSRGLEPHYDLSGFMTGLPRTLHSLHLIQRAVRKEECSGYIIHDPPLRCFDS